MKKNTMIAVANYIKNVPEMSEYYAEMAAEIAKGEEKANVNRNLYARAHDAIAEFLTDVPMTAKEIAEQCPNLPDEFSANKITYGMRQYWKDEFKRHDNGKNAFTYSK